MLVLSRHVDEQIVVKTSDGLVFVTIVRIPSEHRVKVGIEAPRNVSVWRREIYERIQEQRKQ